MNSGHYSSNRCCRGGVASAVYGKNKKNYTLGRKGDCSVFFAIFYCVSFFYCYFSFGCKVHKIVKNNKPISTGWLGLGGGRRIVQVNVNDPAGETASRLSERVRLEGNNWKKKIPKNCKRTLQECRKPAELLRLLNTILFSFRFHIFFYSPGVTLFPLFSFTKQLQ